MTDPTSPASNAADGSEDALTGTDETRLRIEHADRHAALDHEASNAPFYAAFVPAPGSLDPESDFPLLDEGALRASLRDVPPAPEVALPASLNIPADAFRLDMLPPDDQATVRAKLAEYPAHAREAAEAELVRERIIEKGSRFRLTRTLSNASPYHQEVLDLTTEVEQLQRQIDQHHKDIAEIAGYRTGPDGKPVAVPALSDDAAAARARLVDELSRRMRLIAPDGPEAIRRLKEAEERTVAMVKKLHLQARAEHETARMARQINWDQQIRARAETRARMLRNQL